MILVLSHHIMEPFQSICLCFSSFSRGAVHEYDGTTGDTRTRLFVQYHEHFDLEAVTMADCTL
jgi:hypothetical protein